HFARDAKNDEGAEHDAPADDRGANVAVAVAQQPCRGVWVEQYRAWQHRASSAGSGPRKTKMRPICSQSGPCKVCLSRVPTLNSAPCAYRALAQTSTS